MLNVNKSITLYGMFDSFVFQFVVSQFSLQMLQMEEKDFLNCFVKVVWYCFWNFLFKSLIIRLVSFCNALHSTSPKFCAFLMWKTFFRGNIAKTSLKSSWCKQPWQSNTLCFLFRSFKLSHDVIPNVVRRSCFLEGYRLPRSWIFGTIWFVAINLSFHVIAVTLNPLTPCLY